MNRRKIMISFIIILFSGIIICLIMWNSRYKRKYSSTEYSYQPLENFFLRREGLYYIQDEIARYYDKETQKEVTLGRNEGDCYYTCPLGILVYNNKFYCISGDNNKVARGFVKETLYECDCDGNNRKKIFEFPDGGASSMYAYQGKIYYTFTTYDVDENGDVKESETNTISLRVFDLNRKKESILYEIKSTGEQYNGILEICETDDRERIYCLHQFYEGGQDSKDSEEYLSEHFRSEILCYDIKRKEMSDCFTQVPQKSFISEASVYQNFLYCTIQDFEEKGENTNLECFEGNSGHRDIIIKGNNRSIFKFLNQKIYVNNGNEDLIYDINDKCCYKQNNDKSIQIVAISASGDIVALDDGDYSDLKDGDTYTKSRFVPKILTMSDFLLSFQVYKGGKIGNIEYIPVK